MEPWYKAAPRDVHHAMMAAYRMAVDGEGDRLRDISFWLQLYGEDPKQLRGYGYITSAVGADPLPINVVAEVIDAHVAHRVRARPRLMFVPVSGGGHAGYRAHRTARERTQFLDGLWYELDLRSDARDCAVDADTTGCGVLKGYVEHGQPKHERVYAEDLHVDAEDAERGEPTMIYETRLVSRDKLLEAYPEHAVKIMAAGSDNDARRIAGRGNIDKVLVVEGFHLPLAPLKDKEAKRLRKATRALEFGDDVLADDDKLLDLIEQAKWGRHVIAISSGALLDEPWTWDRFPYAVLPGKKARRGYWGQPMAQRLESYQSTINDLLDIVLVNLRLHGNPVTWIPRGSMVEDFHLTDEAGILAEYAGQHPPVRATSAIVPPEIYDRIDWLRQAAFDQEGVSRWAASGEVPERMAGASGAALRTVADVYSGRQIVDGYSWEDWHQDVADLDLRLAQLASEENPNFAALYVGKESGAWVAKELRFGDVDPGDTKFVIRMFPTSDLPQTPAHKLAYFGEMEARGYISPEDSMEQFEIPAVDRLVRLRTAGTRAVEWALDKIIEEGEFIPPEPFMPHMLTRKMAEDAYLLARVDDLPEERLELLRQFAAAAAKLDEQREMAAQPPPPPAPEADMGAPPPMAVPPDDATMPAPPMIPNEVMQ